MTGSCHFSNLRHVCGDCFHALRSPGVSGVEMKIYERSLQALLSSAPRGFAARSRVLARLASLVQIGELARRLTPLLLQSLALILPTSIPPPPPEYPCEYVFESGVNLIKLLHL